MSSDQIQGRAGLSADKLALLVLRAQQKRKKEAEAAEATQESRPGAIPRRAAAGGSGPAPLSFAQQRLWLLDRLEPGSTAYNLPAPLRLCGSLEVAALERALGEIVRRHDALRTTFRVVDGEPVQVVAPPGPLLLPLADLSGLPEPARRPEADRLLAEEPRQPFDLERGPLLRAVLVRVDPAEHLLALDFHHIVSDGWSIGVCFREMAALYGAFRSGGPSPLPELPVQLADFAAWQRGWLQGAVLEEQLGYWRQRLAGSPPALELPTDRLRPAAPTHHGAAREHRLPLPLADRLRELSRREGTSLFMTLLAGFHLLLARLSGQDDVVVGSPSAGRGRIELEGLIGLFLNTLVLRADLSGDPAFRELLGRVKEDVLGAYEHQDLPFEKLLEELQPERQLSRTPIFQVLFNFVSVPDLAPSLPGLAVEIVEPPEPGSKFDFTLYVEEAADGIRLQLVYSTDLFDAPRMEEMLRQLEHLLRQAAAAPEARIGELSLVTAEAAAVLPDPALLLSDAWQGAAHQALARHAAREPERLAVADACGESWTYGELEERSNQLARFLLAEGVGKGDVVAVWAHRSASLVWAVLGALKSGAAFLVLDPAYPAPRLLDYLRIGRPAAWLEVEGAPAPPPEVAAEAAGLCCCWLALPPRSEAERQGFLGEVPDTDPGVDVGPDDAAVIAFTSGSTGVPKGVVGRHGPLTHFYPRMGERFGLGEDDRFGMLSALSHDPLQRDIFTPLWFGATLAVPDPDGIARPGYLAQWVRRESVTVLHLTPAMMELLLDPEPAPPGPAPAVHGLASLRLAFVVGDLLKKADVEELMRRAPAVVCVNLYGSTETQRSVSCFVMPRPGEPGTLRLGREVLPLGRGLEGVQLLVLNRGGRLAGIGEAGEIHVRSRHLARGYLGDEALTAQRFLANPFTGAVGDRVYRTGDLGRYLPDGNVEFAGRADHQVKLRGFRIELGEVEAALARHPAVHECVAIVREDWLGDRRLVAYLVTGAAVQDRDLRTFLGARLPDYMVPSAFVTLPALPLTRTGKVDRRALPPPPEERPADSGAMERSLVEELLAGVWASLLGVERVGPDDHFFALGGQSLLATRLIARVRGVLGVEVPVRAVFEEPTLAGFAALVERALLGGDGTALPPLAPAPRGGSLPASFSQQRLWFLDRLEPGSFAYSLAGAARLAGPLDVAALSAALSAIVRRHEVLRTTFVEEDGEPRQVIAEPAAFPLPVCDLSGLPAAAREEEVLRIARAEARRPYDLARGPLLRAALLRLEEREHALLAGMHHIVSDGWSMSVFERELGAFYRGGASALPALPVQYADFAVWQRQWLRGALLEERLAWWARQLAGAPQVIDLPLDRPRPAVQSYRGGRASLTLGMPLDGVAQRLGATPFMVLLAGFATLLSRYGSQPDVVVGTPIANRGQAELEDLIGFFVNTLALRVDLSGDPGFDALTRRVRDVALGAYARQEVPFERLVDELRPERNLSHAPVFQVTLVLQNLPASDLELAGLTLAPLRLDTGGSQFDLSLFLEPLPEGGLRARIEYARDLFDAATVERLLGHFHRVLEGVVEEGGDGARLSELPLMTEREREQVVTEWNLTEAGIPDEPVHHLVRQWAERTPDALAVAWDGGRLTYGGLADRAARLAFRLRQQGVGPETVVALQCERSPELITAALAVLEAGGAYLPLDPAQPAERLEWMVRDSGAALVLTPQDLGRGLGDGHGRGHGRGTDTLPEGLAYVIYTSGSTGRPKGAELCHHGLSSLSAWHRRTFSPGPADRVSLVAGPGFDPSVWETWGALTAGASLHIPPPELIPSPPALLRWMADEGITVSYLPTPLGEAVLAEPLPQGLALRWLMTGGDRLVRRPAPDAPFEMVNLYGPTECTVNTVAGRVSPWGERAPEIGAPIANTRAYIVDRSLRPVPVGITGELFLAGAGLARGYRGRPELTAERFVPDPFGATGSRLYRTGDLTRWLPTGTIECLGRADAQVKIRGFRIEPGEIEAALAACPGVREAVVVVRSDRSDRSDRSVGSQDDKRLVAYVVLAAESPFEPATLRAWVAERLPGYMVPAAFVLLPKLPLGPNGKVDRRALPAPDATLGMEHREAERTGERNPVEELLAGIWAELLGVPDFPSSGSFFELGGHSLLATRMISRVRAVLGVELPMRTLFEDPTLAGFAARIDRARQSGSGVALPPLVRVPRGGLLPTSFAQQRLWFLDQMEPGSFAYNLAGAVRLEGALDVPALAAALGGIVQRHEALRTTFAAEDGEPQQVIAPPAPLLLLVCDLSGLPDRAREEEARRAALAEARRPYDLTRGPLVRAALLRLGEREHDLLIGMHHIVSDGWSLGIFVRELGALYRGLAAGEPAALPALPIQYADFAVWQRQWLHGEALEEKLAWWVHRLAGAPQVVELPLDRPRPAVQSYRGGRVDLRIGSTLEGGLETAARRLGVTPFMFLLAGFAALLSRYSGQRDVVVGTPIANRGHAELEDLIGFFVNTLALRVDLTGDPAFGELARRVREMALGAYLQQDLPFERLVDELRPERDLSHAPVFQVVLALQNLPESDFDLQGLTLAPLDLDLGRTHFDLSLFLTPERDGGLLARAEYASDLFDAATVERLLGHFQRLLEGAVEEEGDGASLSELVLLGREEREQVLFRWNDTATGYPREATIPGLFAEQVRATPHALALVGDEELTYAELDRRADLLAARLLAAGAGPEEPVGLCAGRSADLIAALLGILKAGGAYVPLDPTYPRERLAGMLEDAGARIVVVQEGLEGSLPEAAEVRLPLRSSPAETEELPVVSRTVHPDQLAYVLFTSGSTGRPKGVAVTHRNVVRLVRETGYLRFGPEEVFLQLAPVSFDASTLEVWGPLLNGGRLALFPPGPPDLQQLGEALESRGVTTLWLTAGLFHQMVDEHLDRLRTVRQLAAGGDVLSPDHVRRALAGLPGATLINGYGPTENTTFTTCHILRDVSDLQPGPVPIGRPIANTRAYLLDSAFQPVPVGIVGQLYAAGEGLARGYSGRPDLTAERFVPDPVSGEPGARLYATGDLARWRPSGETDFLGRADAQVKIRGFRIEPGEIEAVLAGHPGVREAVVVVRSDRSDRSVGSVGSQDDKRLVAYLVAEQGLPAGALRAWMAERLPAYMVPAAFVLLDELPLGPTGKVDRRALPAPAGERHEARRPGERSPVEELIAGIWADLLGAPHVARDDSFFELGGHSLLATRVISRVRAVLGVELPLRAVFEEPTLAGFAALVERAEQAGAALSLPPLVPVPRHGLLPASFAQQRLWFLHRLEPGLTSYNLAGGVRLAGPLDVAALTGALGGIVRRHEALRTTFAEENGELRQVIAEPAATVLPVLDLTGLPAAEREAAMERIAAAEARRPYDLARGPLLRSLLVRLDGQEHALLVGMHHIVSDGWSMGIFVRELGTLYGALEAGLPDLPVQYADYAAWQRQWLSGREMEERLAWWVRQIAGAPQVMDLPLDRPRPPVQSYQGGRAYLVVSGGLEAGLDAVARRLGVTPFMLLLSGFATLLWRYGSQPDLVVGTPIANRGLAEVEDLIGFFANTLALRVDLTGDPELAELAHRVRAVALGAYAHQELPFERLVSELRPERNLSHAPVFQVTFALQNLPVSDLELAGLTLAPLRLDTGASQFDLSLSLQPLPEGGLRARMEYASDLFDAATVERLLGHFHRLLEGIVEEGDGARLSELPLLTESEREQVVTEWNLTEAEIPDEPVHHLVRQWAERTPDALAVAWDGGRLTYGGLVDQAAGLASWLRQQGVGPETVVALRFERSPGLITAALAVLEAGGAYLPLDPAQPTERLEWMVRDSGAALLLTPESLEQGVEDEHGRGTDILPEGLAYVIYTSGSTGRPKGAELCHHGLSSLSAWHRRTFSPGPADRVGLVAGPGFDASVWEMWGALTAGASLHIPPPELIPSPPALLRWMVDEGITVSFLPTPLAEAVLAEPLPQGLALRWLMAGGDRLVRRPAPDLPFEMANLYGPTECTVNAVAGRVSPWGERAPEIGAPIANTRAYIVDRSLRPVPVGVTGELFLAGVGLARGYRGRPELTAERFVPDPFGAAGSRLYRTGDLARWLPAGTIECLGRVDAQVKIRGFRIEPGEIEAVLAACPGVREAVVVVRSDRSDQSDRSVGSQDDKRLVAYVVLAAEGPFEPATLRAWVAERLPAYMVPAAFVLLPKLPLSPSGKVDRRALPAPDAALGMEHREAERTGERSPVEELLAGIWAELLGVPDIPASGSFFELGGHSLLATRMISRVRTVLGVELPLRALFEEPTLAGFAALVERGRQEGAGGSLPPLVPVPRNGSLPTSFAQQRLWFLHRLEPGLTAYNQAGGVRLEGPLDVASLAAALGGIVQRHEALRTTFAEEEGEPRQVIAEPSALPLPIIDLSGLPQREAEMHRIAAAEARRPYDLARGPLMRSLLLRLGSREHALLAGMHHIVSDGWSMGIFVRELGALYRALALGAPAGLPALPVQYADYAAWQRQWLSGEVMEERLAWWLAQLAGAPQVVDLPLDRPRPPVQSYRGGRATLALGRDLEAGLDAAARRLGVTPFMLLLSGFASLLWRYGSQPDLMVGTPIANRGQAEVEGLIGFFANTLALRVGLAGDPEVGELARRVREMALGAYAHQDVPFERLVGELQPERSLSHSPVFQVVLALQNLPDSALDLAGLTLSPLRLETAVSPFDLTLMFSHLPGGGLQASLLYARDLFDAATAERLLGHLQRLLAGMADDGVRVSELPILGEDERAQVLTEWNLTSAGIPDEPVHELVRQWAERTPNALALAWDGGRLTYGELAERAGGLAARLRRQGVGREAVVALRFERSPGLIIAALAVLEAGGAYLPIDPAQPAERLDWMLRDSGAVLLLTAEDIERGVEDGHGRGTDTLPEGLAYVIYTSGSTGLPKGTELRHRGLSNLTAWHRRTYGVGPADRASLVAGPGFDASVWETWSALTAGASLHIPPAETVLKPAVLLRWMAEEKITISFLPTPLAEAVLAEPLPQSLALRWLMAGGDRLVRRPAPDHPFAMANLYGPTESTVIAAAARVAPWGDRAPSIGSPIANTRTYILDRALRPVPVGAAGELYLAGEGLARGYRGRPELTAERLVPDPYGEEGARLYRTGDLARWLPDGGIEFLGRADAQVKVRGFRIEPGEIEGVLASHPQVEAVAVIAREDVPGDRRLAAYVVLAAGSPFEPAALRTWMAERLPAYMVPAALVQLAALPLGSTGKVDRRALPAPADVRQGDTVFASPLTPLEKEVAQVWVEVLGVDRVGTGDSFWELGGHSLLATRMLARLEAAFGIELPLQLLFTAPRLAEFAAALGERMLAGQGAEVEEALAELDGLSEEEIRALLAEEEMA